jgi:hypothetical protein
MTHSQIELLQPDFQVIVKRMIAQMEADPVIKAAGVIMILPRETLRDLDVQMAYYSRYLYNSTGGKADTARFYIAYVRAMFAAAGLWVPTDKECLTPSTLTLKSKHLEGKAIDIAPSRDGKSPWWNAPEEVWQRMGEIGKAAGCRWGGDFKGLNDSPHFEV